MGHWSGRESWNRAKAVGEGGEAKDLKAVEEVEPTGLGEELACKRRFREVVNSMVPGGSASRAGTGGCQSWVTLGKKLHLSEPQFQRLHNGPVVRSQ